MLERLPRVVFVLGKGGVGRSTAAAALGLALADRGERVLVLEWAVADPIAPWFGLPPAGASPWPIAPGLAVANYALDEALRTYFVEHLRLGFVYRRVIRGRPVRRLIEAAPGIAELFFLGQIWWLVSLAKEEAGLDFDRVVVDAPATGHGASLLDLPATLASMGAAGMLAVEIGRVASMMGDPALTGALVVALPEALAVEETLELVPRATARLGRPPLAAFVNRSVRGLASEEAVPRWLPPLARGLSPDSASALAGLQEGLAERAALEVALVRDLAGRTQAGTFALEEQLAAVGDRAPAAVVRALAPALGAALGARS